MPRTSCSECNGSGYITEEKGGALYARICKCARTSRAEQIYQQAAIPQRYHQRCVFETYRPATTLQQDALAKARRYAEEYPALAEGRNGLLFLGSCGTGKTHLAVAILMDILAKKGLPVLFADLNEVYREIRATYDGRGGETEYDIMEPLVQTPLLLLDELGCVASPWAQDTLHYIVNQRYSSRRPTLLTTNYVDEPPQGEVSLEIRIGTRTYSRLVEMCHIVRMDGTDHRRARG